MLRLFSFVSLASLSFFVGCGSKTAATPSAVDNSAVHTDAEMADIQKQAEADAAGSN
jgi:hypothetical protein